jgi:hypothetical protein
LGKASRWRIERCEEHDTLTTGKDCMRNSIRMGI